MKDISADIHGLASRRNREASEPGDQSPDADSFVSPVDSDK